MTDIVTFHVPLKSYLLKISGFTPRESLDVLPIVRIRAQVSCCFSKNRCANMFHRQ